VRATATLVAGRPTRPGRPCRIEHLADAAPVAWRTTPDGVYMVATAAAPVGADRLGLDVHARRGAHLAVRSAAASVLWSGRGTRTTVTARVDGDAVLDWAPEPTITTAGCHHHHEATVRVETGGALRWRELLVLGRGDEAVGRLVSDLAVEMGGRPLLRHRLEIGTDRTWDGPAVLGGHRAVGLLVLGGDRLSPAGPAAGPGWARMPLEGPGMMVLAVGGSAAEAAQRLDAAATGLPVA